MTSSPKGIKSKATPTDDAATYSAQETAEGEVGVREDMNDMVLNAIQVMIDRDRAAVVCVTLRVEEDVS